MRNDYNGWKGHGTRDSAYATWRVALEMFEGYDASAFYDERPTTQRLADYLRDEVEIYVDQVLPDDGPDAVTLRGWIDVFLDGVNWREIAAHILSSWNEPDEQGEG